MVSPKYSRMSSEEENYVGKENVNKLQDIGYKKERPSDNFMVILQCHVA